MLKPPLLPRPHRGVLLWAIGASLVALGLAALSLVLWLRLTAVSREQVLRLAPSPPSTPPAAVEATPAAFAGLQDADVIGRYRFFESGNEVGTIILLPSHSMINKDGTTYRQYHWEIRSDGLHTRWQKSEVLFDVMPKPGCYIATRNGKEYRRMEKLPE
jgi:hypothetical protein